jgi:hypothetical protein
MKLAFVAALFSSQLLFAADVTQSVVSIPFGNPDCQSVKISKHVFATVTHCVVSFASGKQLLNVTDSIVLRYDVDRDKKAKVTVTDIGWHPSLRKPKGGFLLVADATDFSELILFKVEEETRDIPEAPLLSEADWKAIKPTDKAGWVGMRKNALGLMSATLVQSEIYTSKNYRLATMETLFAAGKKAPWAQKGDSGSGLFSLDAAGLPEKLIGVVSMREKTDQTEGLLFRKAFPMGAGSISEQIYAGIEKIMDWETDWRVISR